MPDLEYEAFLRRIAEQEQRIVRQRRLVAGLEAKDMPTKQARELLSLMVIALSTLEDRRNYYER
jgi:hypothetical protein